MCCRKRRGISLLEVLAAMIVLTAVSIPSLDLLADAMRMAKRHPHKIRLPLVAQNLLETERGRLRTDWQAASLSDRIYDASMPGCRYRQTTAIYTDAAIPNDRLMLITVLVYQDENSDSVPNSDEPQLTLSTFAARR